jgi:hypothetical protein
VRSLQSICDFGSVYATFGPDTLALIDETSAWKDPCDGLSALGHCEGTIARRCTAPDEGPRRMIVSDCASLGQTCVEVAQTSVRCVDPGALPTQRSSTLPQCTGMN